MYRAHARLSCRSPAVTPSNASTARIRDESPVSGRSPGRTTFLRSPVISRPTELKRGAFVGAPSSVPSHSTSLRPFASSDRVSLQSPHISAQRWNVSRPAMLGREQTGGPEALFHCCYSASEREGAVCPVACHHLRLRHPLCTPLRGYFDARPCPQSPHQPSRAVFGPPRSCAGILSATRPGRRQTGAQC